MVFRGFRRLVESIQALTDAVLVLNETQRQLGPALERLNTLERTRFQFEAQCEGMLLKADGKLKAATSAEQRERQLKKANEKHRDPFGNEGEAEGEDPADVAIAPHAGASSPEGVPAVRLALASNNKAHAVKTKWGIA